MKKGKSKNYFPGGNTARGFNSFYEYLPHRVNKKYIIKGGPGTGKSTFMKDIASKLTNRGYDLEYHWCSSDSNSLDGVVIPLLKTAIIDGTAPHLIDPVYPGAVGNIINLGEYWNKLELRKNKNQIIELTENISNSFKTIYSYLNLASLIKKEIKSYYKEGFIIDEANKKTAKIKKEILPDPSEIKSGEERHLFASAITPGGYINYLDNLTEDIKNRYLLKGKPGTAKTTLIETVGNYCLKHGYFVLFLHCSLDPENIDTIIIPELNTALINDTYPHTLTNKNKDDRIINMMDCIKTSILTRNHDTLQENNELYTTFMNKALAELKKEKKLHDELEKYYIQAMDFSKVEQRCEKLYHELLNY